MKSRIIETPKEKTEKPFPKLMISNSGRVVLFHEKNQGISVIDPTGEPIGEYSKGWKMNLFNDFDQSVILSND